MNYPLPLCSRADQQLARQLIESNNLRFEDDFHDLVGIFKDGILVGCCGRRGRVMKMLAVLDAYRGEGLAGDLLSELMRLGRAAGEQGFFIFTRHCTVNAFSWLGFKPLTEYSGITWLEHGGEIRQYLSERAALVRPGHNAAVFTDADPFTLGHLHLIKRAAAEADTIYVFVRADGPHALPLATRLTLTRQSVAAISNVVVTDTGPYRVPVDRFPGYSLRPGDDAIKIRVGLEEQCFSRHIAKPFHIQMRVVGVEPPPATDQSYHAMIQSHLAHWDIRLLDLGADIPPGSWLSASQLQTALHEGDEHTLATALPAPVLDHLRRTWREK
ncbi:MAG: hypothetical protein IAF00_08715 [Phycisphaerales bacterium]|nr:hypothetical protein [Phycisphaerales bacterium]